jgi:hypothetical protein
MKMDAGYAIFGFDLDEFLAISPLFYAQVNGLDDQMIHAAAIFILEREGDHIVTGIAGIQGYFLEHLFSHSFVAPIVEMNQFNGHDGTFVELSERIAEFAPVLWMYRYVFHKLNIEREGFREFAAPPFCGAFERFDRAGFIEMQHCIELIR